MFGSADDDMDPKWVLKESWKDQKAFLQHLPRCAPLNTKTHGLPGNGEKRFGSDMERRHGMQLRIGA